MREHTLQPDRVPCVCALAPMASAICHQQRSGAAAASATHACRFNHSTKCAHCKKGVESTTRAAANELSQFRSHTCAERACERWRSACSPAVAEVIKTHDRGAHHSHTRTHSHSHTHSPIISPYRLDEFIAPSETCARVRVCVYDAGLPENRTNPLSRLKR